MNAFRITHTKWAGKLSGSGYAGRWNSKGKFVVYTTRNRALACLENLVHRSGEGLDANFSITEINIPDRMSSEHLDPESLPEGWYETKNIPYCQSLGDRWLDEKRSLLLEVPSSIIPDETNILINPGHGEFPKISVRQITPFRFDRRLMS